MIWKVRGSRAPMYKAFCVKFGWEANKMFRMENPLSQQFIPV